MNMNIKSLLLSKFFPLIFSRTARNTYLVLSGNSIAMIFAFFHTVILVRILSISDFGYFSALFSFLLLISDVSDIGIGVSLSRFLPPLKKNPDREASFLKSAFLLQLAIIIGITSLIFIFAPFIAYLFLHGQERIILVRIIVIGITGSILTNFFIAALSAREQFSSSAFINSILGIARVAFLTPLIYFSLISLEGVVWALVICLIFSVVVGLILMKPKFIFAKRAVGDISRLLHFTSFLGIARSLTAVSGRLDVLMLIALTNSVEAGIYSTASRVASLYPLFTGSFQTVLGPKISTISDFKHLKKFLSKVIVGTLGLIASIIFLIIISEPFMLILFGPKVAASIPVLRYLLVSMVFFVASTPAVVVAIYFLKKPYILTVNSILQLMIVLLGNLIFIPTFGKIGPAVSLILAYGASFFLTSLMSYSLLKKYISEDKFDTITRSEMI